MEKYKNNVDLYAVSSILTNSCGEMMVVVVLKTK